MENPDHYGPKCPTYRLERCKFCKAENPDHKGHQCPLNPNAFLEIGPLHDLDQVILTTKLPELTYAISRISACQLDIHKKWINIR